MHLPFFVTFLLTLCIMKEFQAQPVSQGTIKFKQTRYIEFENMPSDMPKSQEIFMRLQFNKDQSLYDKDPDHKEEVNPNDNSPRMFRRMREVANKIIYKEQSSGMVLEQTSFFGKDFLIEDTIQVTKWKISAGEQKSILGYTCMKATFKDSTQNLVAFFTPQIPLKWGPDKYGYLPGIILELQSAQLHIIATEIKTLSPEIKKPEKGEQLTRKEFDTLREQKMKEQREMWGGRGNEVRIIRN